MNNENMLEAKVLKSNYLQAIQSRNIALSIKFKQEFYSKGYNELLDIDKQTQEGEPNDR